MGCGHCAVPPPYRNHEQSFSIWNTCRRGATSFGTTGAAREFVTSEITQIRIPWLLEDFNRALGLVMMGLKDPCKASTDNQKTEPKL